MASEHVDKSRLKYPHGTPEFSDESGVEFRDGAFVIVSQAYCPNGHDLVAHEGASFDGFPGITLRVVGDDADGLLTLSPMHGDSRTEGVAVTPGQRYALRCPVCGVDLPVFARCDCGTGLLRTLSLVGHDEGEIVTICDVAGCHRSRVAHGLDVLAVFTD